MSGFREEDMDNLDTKRWANTNAQIDQLDRAADDRERLKKLYKGLRICTIDEVFGTLLALGASALFVSICVLGTRQMLSPLRVLYHTEFFVTVLMMLALLYGVNAYALYIVWGDWSKNRRRKAEEVGKLLEHPAARDDFNTLRQIDPQLGIDVNEFMRSRMPQHEEV